MSVYYWSVHILIFGYILIYFSLFCSLQYPIRRIDGQRAVPELFTLSKLLVGSDGRFLVRAAWELTKRQVF